MSVSADRTHRRQAPSADGDLLRSVFRQHAAGVAVVTAHTATTGPVGFTATSLSSVAAAPPMLSFGISTTSSSWPAVAEAEHVGVHILAEDQLPLATTFATSGADRFGAATGWSSGPYGVPLLDGVLARVVARVAARVPAGAHRVVLAELVTGDVLSEGRPLLYHRGRFTGLQD
ncbi:flavin reductase family protein [Streptomyces sp. NPDC059740]|uniref:flavin reductase family protein n=1 Tax=Streptomyces sp. NPDC059740 TaxID=3346926 RepID=UPI0036460D89